MDRPRIRHIAINVEDREKAAQYYKDVFKLEEKERGPNGTIYLSDGFIDVALIKAPDLPWGIHHFGFVDERQGHRGICRDHRNRKCLRCHCRELDQRPRGQSGGHL